MKYDFKFDFEHDHFDNPPFGLTPDDFGDELYDLDNAITPYIPYMVSGFGATKLGDFVKDCLAYGLAHDVNPFMSFRLSQWLFIECNAAAVENYLKDEGITADDALKGKLLLAAVECCHNFICLDRYFTPYEENEELESEHITAVVKMDVVNFLQQLACGSFGWPGIGDDIKQTLAYVIEDTATYDAEHSAD